MINLINHPLGIKSWLPEWLHAWIGTLSLVFWVALIILASWLLRRTGKRLLSRLAKYYHLPRQVEITIRRLSNFVIWAGTAMAILHATGVSASVLWTAFTGFAAVAAVAFFAAWSVLSNLFCSILIFTTSPFRLGDQVELLEDGAKPGLKGQVLDINLIYTTLRETEGATAGVLLQIPNTLFFQRGLRRWKAIRQTARIQDKPQT